ncbi:DUF1697 domain-containing protein [Candidatus Saccharibacteria bacterium]|nr:DUF1697 domain-containing protein [Candidatus Saccharibacteria bacterium]
MKYIALLRGINVGGNNKVAMADLRKCFDGLDFDQVITYINSGNVVFESSQSDKIKLVKLCEDAIEEQFGFRIVCSIVSAAELRAAIKKAPNWWAKDSEYSHNALFAIAPRTAREISKGIGQIKPEYERVFIAEPIIFWSAARETIGRTRYSKIVGTEAYRYVTIRNANTTRKLMELST